MAMSLSEIRNQDMKAWLQKLGYDGNIPENLDLIYNKTSCHVWDYLMENVGTRQEAKNIKIALTIHRIKEINKDGDLKEMKNIPEELKLFNRKMDLMNKLEQRKYAVAQKENLNRKLEKDNTMKRFITEQMKSKIKEKEEREFILRKKCQILEKDILQAEQILNIPINTFSKHENVEQTKQILKKCSEVLKVDISNWQKSEEKTKRTTTIHSLDKENTYSNLPKTTITRESIAMGYGNCLTPSTNYHQLSPSTGGIRKTAKKESRGHEISLSTIKKTAKKNNFLEKYLNPSTSGRKNKKIPGSGRVRACLFSETISSTKKGFDEEEENFLIPSISDLSIFSTVNKKNLVSSTNKDIKESIVNKISNESVTNDMRHLLKEYSWNSIWKVFETLDKDFYCQILKLINYTSSPTNLDADELARLQAIHVRTEIGILREKSICKQINRYIIIKKKEICNAINNSGQPKDVIEKMKKNFELHLQKLALETEIEEMKKEINKQNNVQLFDMAKIKNETIKIMEEICFKKKSVREYIGGIPGILHSIEHAREQTNHCIRKVVPYTSDLSWCHLLEDPIYTKEILTFKEFPLDHNRRCINTDPSIYYRDLPANELFMESVNNEHLWMLAKIMKSPGAPIESILLNILQANRKMDVLKSMRIAGNSICKQYTSQSLNEQESYRVSLMETFDSMLKSSRSRRSLAAASIALEIKDLWVQMPFRDCIPSFRIIDGQPYKHYEKKFDFYYDYLV